MFAAAPGLSGDHLTRWLSDFIEALGVGEARLMVFVA